jgi:hypothetical protein
MPLFPIGADKLASTKLTAAATTTATLTFPSYDFLWIICAVTGFGTADLPRIRFNGITAVANYTQRMGYFGTAASATVSTQADNGATNGAFLLGQASSTTARVAVVTVNNHTQSTIKPVSIEVTQASAGATTEINPLVLYSGGEFTAAAATTQVTSVVMLAPTNAMSIGSGLAVFGMNML